MNQEKQEEMRVEGLLRQSPHSEVRKLRVSIQDNHIILTGRVRSFYMKQMAQEALRGHTNGHEVVNEISVD